MCNYTIQLPVTADPNDVLTFSVEWISGAIGTLVQGSSLSEATRKYTLGSGQSYTARKGQNFYLLIEATTNAEYAFKVKYTALAGTGTPEPGYATIPSDYVDPYAEVEEEEVTEPVVKPDPDPQQT